MRYFVYLFSIGVLLFSATWAYRVNYETREVVNRIKMLQDQIQKEEEKLIMLEGEWAYLNRPDRLDELAERFFAKLSLMPISADNYAKIDILGFRNTYEFEPYSIEPLKSSSNKPEVKTK